MFLSRLVNEGPEPVLEQMLRFTEARQGLLAENVANVSTPNYRQKDLSVDKFQQMLRDRVEQQQSAGPGATSFDDVSAAVENPRRGILFHDGNNRSMEELMSDNAKNALMHNLVVELLRRQYQTMNMALKESPTG
jgi:flagellar basal-body rod protein FlgB